MILPFNALPCTEAETEPRPRRILQPLPSAEHPETDEDDSSSDSSDDDLHHSLSPGMLLQLGGRNKPGPIRILHSRLEKQEPSQD